MKGWLFTGIALFLLVACGASPNTPQQVIIVTPTPVSIPSSSAAPSSDSVSGSGTTCPADHPVKGNDNSMIYHVIGQQYYAVTNARHCFRTPADAEQAGYRASKV